MSTILRCLSWPNFTRDTPESKPPLPALRRKLIYCEITQSEIKNCQASFSLNLKFLTKAIYILNRALVSLVQLTKFSRFEIGLLEQRCMNKPI